MHKNILLATLTCPNPMCRHRQRVMVPTTFCQLFYTCEACSLTHAHKSGDCCVFCSYADKPCPSMREEQRCGSPGLSALQGGEKEWMPMKNQSSLELLAAQLAAHLDCTQDVACQQILQGLACFGQPLAPMEIANRLQISLEQLSAHLNHVPDTEFDHEGNILGWGITLVPTPHQFWVEGRALFTWCAFDTVLFPPLLALEAQVQSTCTASGQPIRFRVGPEGIQELTPTTSVLSLVLPAERCDCVRGTFCQQSLFFASKQVAASWAASHPEAALLSVEEAAMLGHLTAELWSAVRSAESRVKR